MRPLFNPRKAKGYDKVTQMRPDLREMFLYAVGYLDLWGRFLEYLSEHGNGDGTIWADRVLSKRALLNLQAEVGIDDVILFEEEVYLMMGEVYKAYLLTEDEQWGLIVDTLLAFAIATGTFPTRDYAVQVCFFSCGGLVDRETVDLVYETFQIDSRPVAEVVAGWTDH